ncbi:hypothetical protein [Haliea sp. E17]|uniref:hypothetical protein n=1 Tax=Haliea sp. E17 TaxID=3401576 RepID=UPI003AAF9C1A
MTHVALVGARMDAFTALGYHSRSELALRRALPRYPGKLAGLSKPDQRKLLAKDLPVWVHNAITDPDFPGRDQLVMPLRRFEGELRDSRDNEVIAAVLNAGFRNRPLDPLNLPDNMPLRQRCSMLMHVGPWQEAYRQLEAKLVETLQQRLDELDHWLATAEPEIDPAIAV